MPQIQYHIIGEHGNVHGQVYIPIGKNICSIVAKIADTITGCLWVTTSISAIIEGEHMEGFVISNSLKSKGWLN